MGTTNMSSLRTLADIEPGVTSLSQIRKQFGDPESEGLSPGYKVAGGDVGGDLIWRYESRGITIFVHRNDKCQADPLVEEVRIGAPFRDRLCCGLHVGQDISAARGIVLGNFTVTDEYDDAIYFIPEPGRALLGCAENLDTSEVVYLSLLRSDTTAD